MTATRCALLSIVIIVSTAAGAGCGCGDDTGAVSGESCQKSDDCASGLTCIGGACQERPAGGGAGPILKKDAGHNDAGHPGQDGGADAGVDGSIDAETDAAGDGGVDDVGDGDVDAGTDDGGDAETTDGMTADDASADTSETDTGADAGDGAAADVGSDGGATPVTALGACPAAFENKQEEVFAFSASDPDASFECALDGAPWTACASPHGYSSLSDGAHTFTVRAVLGGTPDPAPPQCVWVTDTVAPITQINSGPGAPCNTRSVPFTFACNEPGCTFECSLDGAAFAACTSPKDYAGLADGTHTFDIRATDRAMNTDQTPAPYGWTAVTTGPDTCIDPPGPFGSCQSDASTRVSVGYQLIATPFGDCHAVPGKCAPGADAWRLVRVVTMENDFVKVSLADGAGDKVFGLQRKIELVRDAADWAGHNPPDTTHGDARFPPDASGREWLLRAGASATGCDSRPENTCTLTTRDVIEAKIRGEPPACVPRCTWETLWGDDGLGGDGAQRDQAMRDLERDARAAGVEWPGIERGTPHWVHNIVGTGSQYSTALRDKAETKDACMLMPNWNPNSNGSCDGTANGGCHINAALGNNCDIDVDTLTGAPLVSSARGPFRLRDQGDPASGDEALDHPDAQAPTTAEVGARRVYFRSGMWRSFGGPVSNARALAVDVPGDGLDKCREIFDDSHPCPPPGVPDVTGWATYCCPDFVGDVDDVGYLGKEYWNNTYTWRPYVGGPLCRDNRADECTCDLYNGDVADKNAVDAFLATCACCPGGFTTASPAERFNRSVNGYAGLVNSCPGGAAICNGWPQEPGFARPFPDEGQNREDIWSESYVCLQGPEVIVQMRLHHPGDDARHEPHDHPGHGMPQAHQRGVFSRVAVGDRGRAQIEQLPPPAFADSKRLGDRASDNWVGLLDDSAPYGVFLYEDFDLGVDPAGHSYGKLDEMSGRPSDLVGAKAKIVSYSFRFADRDQVLDREHRYIFANPSYVVAHTRCYNLGLAYPCGLDHIELVDDDSPILRTWVNTTLDPVTGGRSFDVWSTPLVPDGDLCEDGAYTDGCWRVDDIVDRLLPLHYNRASGTVDIYECVRDKNGEMIRYLAACPANEPACGGVNEAPCAPSNQQLRGPIGRLLVNPGLEGRTIWNRDLSFTQSGQPKSDGRASDFHNGFTPEWRCDDDDVGVVAGCTTRGAHERYGYNLERDGFVLGFAAAGNVISTWISDGATVAALAAPVFDATHVEDVAMLLASPPRELVNGVIDLLHPRAPVRRAHPVFLCGDLASSLPFFSTRSQCDDAAVADALLLGLAGYAYDEAVSVHSHPGLYENEQATIPVTRCVDDLGHHTVVVGAQICPDVGVGVIEDAFLGYAVSFPKSGLSFQFEPR